MLIDWFTVGAQLINFTILVWLLKRLLYRRILKAMDERQAAILAEAEEAEAHKKRAESEAEVYSSRLASFESEYATRMKEAEQEVSAFRTRQLSEARTEIREQRSEWIQALERQKREFTNELRLLVGDQICETSRKLLSELADAPLEQQVLKHFAASLGTDPDKRKTLTDAAGDDVVFETTFPVDDETEALVRKSLAAHLPPDCKVHFEQSEEDTTFGVVVRTGSHRIEWNLDSYAQQLAKNVEIALAAEDTRQIPSEPSPSPVLP